MSLGWLLRFQVYRVTGVFYMVFHPETGFNCMDSLNELRGRGGGRWLSGSDARGDLVPVAWKESLLVSTPVGDKLPRHTGTRGEARDGRNAAGAFSSSPQAGLVRTKEKPGQEQFTEHLSKRTLFKMGRAGCRRGEETISIARRQGM